MFCPNCGTNVPDDSKFCINCGYAFQNKGDEQFGAATVLTPENAPTPTPTPPPAPAQFSYIPPQPPQKNGSKPWIIAIVVILAIAIVGAVGYFIYDKFIDDDDDDDNGSKKSISTSEPADDYPAKLDEDTIVGTWEIRYKFSEYEGDSYSYFFEGNEEMDFDIVMSFKFGSNGTVELTQYCDVTEKKLNKLSREIREWLLDGGIYDVEDMDEDEMEEYLYEYEDGMDIEDYIDEYYISTFEYIAEGLEEKPETLKLNYELDEDCLYIAMDEYEDIDYDYYWGISYKKGVITITEDEISGGGFYEDAKLIYKG